MSQTQDRQSADGIWLQPGFPRQPYPEQPEEQPGFPEQPGPTGPEIPEEQPGVPEIPEQ